MSGRYPRAIPPNHALDYANLLALDLGKPLVADIDKYVVSVAMGNKTYTLAKTSSEDSPALARNVTVTRTVVDTADTPGKVTVIGHDAAGNVITEDIVPGNTGVTVAGIKAFADITSIVGSGWTISGGADTITVGFGALIGLPATIAKSPFAADLHAGTAVLVVALLNRAIQACTVAEDGTVAGTTFDMSAGSYDGTKRAAALYLR